MSGASSETDFPDREALLASIPHLKGWVKRKINAAMVTVDNISDPPSSHDVKDLLDHKQVIEDQFKRLEQAYFTILSEDSSADYKKHSDELDEEEKKKDVALKKLRDAYNKTGTPPTPSPRAPPARSNFTNDVKVKPNTTLQPDRLSREHNMVEMKSWAKKFRAWYASSNMSLASPMEQQAYFRMVIDTQLEAKLADKIEENTPIYASAPTEVSCMALLEEEFDLQYPLLTRQVDFFGSKQQKGQLFSDWAAQLKALGDEADLSTMTPDMLYIMKYLTGVSDVKLREKFFKEHNPSLKQLDRIVHQHEVAEQSIKAMANPVVEVRQMSRKIPSLQQLNNEKKCYRCGVSGHAPDKCNAKEMKCHGCEQKGHLKRVCQVLRNKKGGNKREKTRAVTEAKEEQEDPPPKYESEEEEAEEEVEGAIARIVKIRHIPDPHTPRVDIKVNGRFWMTACADTGTTKTIISYDIAKLYGLKLYKASEILLAANGEIMKCEGKTPLKLAFQGMITNVMALVTSSMKNEMLISMNDLKKMKILPDDFPNVIRKVHSVATEEALVDKIKDDFKDVLSDKLSNLPMIGEPMTIHLNDDAKPTRCLTARNTPLHWQEPSEEAIREMLDSEILVRETGPSDWVNPGFFVAKGDQLSKQDLKEGMVIVTLRDLRLVVDYTGLNRYVKRPVHPFPATKDILNRIPAGTKYFGVCDAVQGYFQIELSEESSKLTTFILPSGKYRFKRAPMGLSASSDEWCRRSDEAIAGLPGVMKLVDDIIVMAPTLEVLEDRMKTVLERCRQFRITISRKKFKIGQEVKFGGHIISAQGVKADPDKTKAIRDFKTPGNITDLRSFLGLANQLASFHPDLAHVTANLRPLLQKNTAFNWLQEHDTEFQKVKDLLLSDVVMKYYARSLPTQLLTDASRKQGLGFALVQTDEEERSD